MAFVNPAMFALVVAPNHVENLLPGRVFSATTGFG
jgi:hypothetical protein